MPTENSPSAGPQPRTRRLPIGGYLIIAATVCVAGIVILLESGRFNIETDNALSGRERLRALSQENPRSVSADNMLIWWDAISANVKKKTICANRPSNIHPSDYAGPESCKKCHPKNYETWSRHPHKWMNALATDSTVKGDFSGKASIDYLGGKGVFFREDAKYLMRLTRGNVRRIYHITQTIGSRFFQYYVGKQIEGPESKEHKYYNADHVMRFGYWLEPKQWVPVVHVHGEKPDGERYDPFDAPDDNFQAYSQKCSVCHTTFAMADALVRSPGLVGRNSPHKLHWHLWGYLQQIRPEIIGDRSHPADFREKEIRPLIKSTGYSMKAPKYAVTLGISCEACHLGAKEHASKGRKSLPRFFPSSPHLRVECKSEDIHYGRTHANVNWACGRCHTGARPKYAAGMGTWNSTEHADAMLGGCYSQLRCIDCHNPHRGIGPSWPHTADHDDASCLRCHDKFRPEQALREHTHHNPGSPGARCMNCHMPRINEGLQEAVRTHMIYSPTRADMIEANHPNACNLCHTDKKIDWTLTHLKKWYGAEYNEAKIAANYRHRDLSVAVGWLKGEKEAVRLVAADALTRSKNKQALSHILKALDDPYLLNRQFAQRGIEKMLDVKLSEFGYRFYMRPDERRGPIENIRRAVLSKK